MKTIRRGVVALVLAAGIGAAIPSVGSANVGWGAFREPTFTAWWCDFSLSSHVACVPGPTGAP
jgi:hypothetical protein